MSTFGWKPITSSSFGINERLANIIECCQDGHHGEVEQVIFLHGLDVELSTREFSGAAPKK